MPASRKGLPLRPAQSRDSLGDPIPADPLPTTSSQDEHTVPGLHNGVVLSTNPARETGDVTAETNSTGREGLDNLRGNDWDFVKNRGWAASAQTEAGSDERPISSETPGASTPMDSTESSSQQAPRTPRTARTPPYPLTPPALRISTPRTPPTPRAIPAHRPGPASVAPAPYPNPPLRTTPLPMIDFNDFMTAESAQQPQRLPPQHLNPNGHPYLSSPYHAAYMARQNNSGGTRQGNAGMAPRKTPAPSAQPAQNLPQQGPSRIFTDNSPFHSPYHDAYKARQNNSGSNSQGNNGTAPLTTSVPPTIPPPSTTPAQSAQQPQDLPQLPTLPSHIVNHPYIRAPYFAECMRQQYGMPAEMARIFQLAVTNPELLHGRYFSNQGELQNRASTSTAETPSTTTLSLATPSQSAPSANGMADTPNITTPLYDQDAVLAWCLHQEQQTRASTSTAETPRTESPTGYTASPSSQSAELEDCIRRSAANPAPNNGRYINSTVYIQGVPRQMNLWYHSSLPQNNQATPPIPATSSPPTTPLRYQVLNILPSPSRNLQAHYILVQCPRFSIAEENHIRQAGSAAAAASAALPEPAQLYREPLERFTEIREARLAAEIKARRGVIRAKGPPVQVPFTKTELYMIRKEDERYVGERHGGRQAGWPLPPLVERDVFAYLCIRRVADDNLARDRERVATWEGREYASRVQPGATGEGDRTVVAARYDNSGPDGVWRVISEEGVFENVAIGSELFDAAPGTPYVPNKNREWVAEQVRWAEQASYGHSRMDGQSEEQVQGRGYLRLYGQQAGEEHTWQIWEQLRKAREREEQGWDCSETIKTLTSELERLGMSDESMRRMAERRREEGRI